MKRTFNTDISHKKRYQLQLNNFKGVDYLHSINGIANNRASDICNLIRENGMLHRRKGFEEQFSMGGMTVKGIFTFGRLLGERTIVHANGSLYQVNSDNTYTSIYTNDALSADKEGHFFAFGEDCYYLFNGLYLKISLSGSSCAVVPVSTVAYIPRTTINIPYYGAENDNSLVLDQPNLCTRQRWNEFDFPTWSSTKAGKEEYILDGNFNENLEFVIVLLGDFSIGTTKVDELDLYSNSTNIVFIGDKLHYCASCEDGVLSPFDSGTNVAGLSIERKKVDGYTRDVLVVDYDTINSVNTTYSSDEDKTNKVIINSWNEMRILYYHITESERNDVRGRKTNRSDEEIIGMCTFSTLYGYNGERDRVFVGGGEEWNKDYWSECNDPTYFPELNYATFGTSSTKITGYALLNNGALAIFKEESSQEPTIYFRTFNMVTATTATGEIVANSTMEVYPIQKGNIGEGLINSKCLGYINQEVIFLGNSGIFALTLGENVTSQVIYSRARSRLINSKLLSHTLSNARCIVYKNRFYCAVNDDKGTVYVGDGNDLFQLNDDVNTYQFEWYVWRGIKAKIWFIKNDELYFVDNESRVCKFVDNATCDTYNYYITVSNNISMATAYTISDGKLVFNDDYSKYLINGNKIKIDGTEYTMKEVQNSDGVLLSECEVVDKGDSRLIIHNGSILTGDDTKFDYCKLVDTTLTASFDDKDVIFPVQATISSYYISGALELGNALYEKKLHSMTVVPIKMKGSKVKVGYKTRSFDKVFDVQGTNYIDLTKGASDLSLDVVRPISQTIPLYDKTNYIMFTMNSDTDFGIVEVLFIYSLIGTNEGVK